jgi:hypothetical protein
MLFLIGSFRPTRISVTQGGMLTIKPRSLEACGHSKDPIPQLYSRVGTNSTIGIIAIRETANSRTYAVSRSLATINKGKL